MSLKIDSQFLSYRFLYEELSIVQGTINRLGYMYAYCWRALKCD